MMHISTNYLLSSKGTTVELLWLNMDTLQSGHFFIYIPEIRPQKLPQFGSTDHSKTKYTFCFKVFEKKMLQCYVLQTEHSIKVVAQKSSSWQCSCTELEKAAELMNNTNCQVSLTLQTQNHI